MVPANLLNSGNPPGMIMIRLRSRCETIQPYRLPISATESLLSIFPHQGHFPRQTRNFKGQARRLNGNRAPQHRSSIEIGRDYSRMLSYVPRCFRTRLTSVTSKYVAPAMRMITGPLGKSVG